MHKPGPDIVIAAMAPQITPSDIFPAVLRFLTETGLTKSAKNFQKETGVDADAAASLPKLEELYSTWMATKGANGTALNGKANVEITMDSAVLSKKEKKKKKQQASEVEAEVAEEAPAEEEVPKKKKRKKSMDAEEEAPVEAPVEEAPKKKKKKATSEPVVQEEEEPAEPPADQEAAPEKKKKKNKDKEEKAEQPKGEVFRRVDDAAWRAKIEARNPRLLDNTHKAKVKFGVCVDTGDSWADKASEDLLKVKGKDFRKEMMKKKKASWKGGGSLDQGVNSIPFSDSDDE